MSFRQYLAAQVQQLLTPNAQLAIANLLALSPVVLPDLIDEFWHARNPELRATLVFVIAQFGDPAALEFLIAAMDDVHEQTWMNALDGLVNIGGPATMRRLTSFMVSLNPDDIRGAWIMETIEQIAADGAAGARNSC